MKLVLNLICLLFVANAFASSQNLLFLSSCPLTSDVKTLVTATEEKSNFLKHKIIRDIKAKLYQGYTNNEITPLSKERITTGVTLRWEDIFGSGDRDELSMAQGKSLLHGQKYKSKELLKKWVKFYFQWKWGNLYRDKLEEIAKISKEKSKLNIDGISNQLQKLRWTELNERTNLFLDNDNKLKKYFSECLKPASLKAELELGQNKLLQTDVKNDINRDYRIYCDNEKIRLNKQFAETNKRVKFNIGGGYGHNRQLASDGRIFGEVRGVLEMELALDPESFPESKQEHCDFEFRQMELEKAFKANSIPDSISVFNTKLSTQNKLSQLFSSKNALNSFSDAEGRTLMDEFVKNIESLMDVDYELSSESIANEIIENI